MQFDHIGGVENPAKETNSPGSISGVHAHKATSVFGGDRGGVNPLPAEEKDGTTDNSSHSTANVTNTLQAGISTCFSWLGQFTDKDTITMDEIDDKAQAQKTASIQDKINDHIEDLKRASEQIYE